MRTRRLLLAALLALGVSPAFAQAPPAVPALPDAQRQTSYTITGSTCACAVGFQLYGDGVDYGNWVEVYVNNRYIDPSAYTITSPTGPLASIPRPVTDAVLTFNAQQTGTVVIVGARRPRRVTQFPEGRGVAARDLNQAFTDLTAQNREMWDRANELSGRVLQTQPGNVLGLLPAPSLCSNATLAFGLSGLSPICVPSTALQVVTSAAVSISNYGAKCDGATDDSAAIQAALNANGGGTVLIPISLNGCLFNSVLYSSQAHGPIRVRGEGPGSKLVVNSAAGGLTLQGSCGLQADQLYIDNVQFTNGSGGTSAYALKIDGAAAYGVTDVTFNAGVNPFTKGLWLHGAQQGRVQRGYNTGSTDGIYLDDCPGFAGVGSNGVDLSAMEFFDVHAAINLQGSASDLFIHDNHEVNSAYGIIFNQNSASSGAGPASIYSNHLEVNATAGLLVTSGTVNYYGNNDYNPHSIDNFGRANIDNNLIDGSVTFELGSSGHANYNVMNNSFVDNTGVAGAVLNQGNVGNGQPHETTYWTTAGQFTSSAGSAGDILTLQPAPLAGNWGMTIHTAGGGAEAYLQLHNAATLAGNTSFPGLTILSAPGGTSWGFFNSNNFGLPANDFVTPIGGDSTTALKFADASFVPYFTLDSINHQVIGRVVTTGVFTVAGLPTCSGTFQGARAFVTDQATAIAYHGAVTGGGSSKQGVTCDGSAWYQD